MAYPANGETDEEKENDSWPTPPLLIQWHIVFHWIK
jgi:hypothetical protein